MDTNRLVIQFYSHDNDHHWSIYGKPKNEDARFVRPSCVCSPLRATPKLYPRGIHCLSLSPNKKKKKKENFTEKSPRAYFSSIRSYKVDGWRRKLYSLPYTYPLSRSTNTYESFPVWLMFTDQLVKTRFHVTKAKCKETCCEEFTFV